MKTDSNYTSMKLYWMIRNRHKFNEIYRIMVSFFCIVLFHRKHEYIYIYVHVCIYLYKQEKICLNKARSIKSWLLPSNKVSTLYLSHSLSRSMVTQSFLQAYQSSSLFCFHPQTLLMDSASLDTSTTGFLTSCILAAAILLWNKKERRGRVNYNGPSLVP